MIPDKIIKNFDVNEDGKIDGYQFNFKNPFYTAEPISAIEDFLISIDGEKVEEIVTRAAVLKRQRPVHVGFGGIEFWVAEEFAWQFGVVQAHGDDRFLTVPAERV